MSLNGIITWQILLGLFLYLQYMLRFVFKGIIVIIVILIILMIMINYIQLKGTHYA